MALQLEKGTRETTMPELATTHLNLCTIYN
jgi:hypothetical protein